MIISNSNFNCELGFKDKINIGFTMIERFTNVQILFYYFFLLIVLSKLLTYETHIRMYCIHLITITIKKEDFYSYFSFLRTYELKEIIGWLILFYKTQI